jgi:hypothetical protein
MDRLDAHRNPGRSSVGGGGSEQRWYDQGAQWGKSLRRMHASGICDTSERLDGIEMLYYYKFACRRGKSNPND